MDSSDVTVGAELEARGPDGRWRQVRVLRRCGPDGSPAPDDCLFDVLTGGWRGHRHASEMRPKRRWPLGPLRLWAERLAGSVKVLIARAGGMGNARRAARRIAESEGARRERETHELEQQFKEPAYKGERPTAPARGRDQADRAGNAYGEALDSARSVLDQPQGSELRAVLDAAWNSESDADVAAFCRTVAGEIPGGPVKAWLSRLSDALKECARAGDELNKAGERLPGGGPDPDSPLMQ